MLELREDTAVWANNIFCPKVDQVETHFSGLAFGSQNLQNWGYTRGPPPRKCRKMVLSGGGVRTRGGDGGCGTTSVTFEPAGESSQMRAGGATEAIWDDSAGRSERACARVPPRAYALMYSTFAPGGAGTTKIRPERRAPRAQLLGKKQPQGWFLACADGTFQTHQYPRNKKMLRNFCARTS